MGCKKLSRRQTARVVTGVGAIVFVVACATAFYGLDEIVKQQIAKELVLKENGGQVWDYFKETPIDVFMSFYLFNITNPPETMHKDWIPQVQEVGPYVYLEKRWKEDINFSADGNIVEFRQYRSFHFDEERSNGLKEDDLITHMNLPIFAVLSLAFGKHAVPAVASDPNIPTMLSKWLGNIEEDLFFMRHTVKDIMFAGARSEYLDILAPFLPLIQNLITLPAQLIVEDSGKLRFAMYPKNNTHDGAFSVFTGRAGIDNYMQIDTWEGSDFVDFWYGERCNKIQGSDGTSIKPFISKSDRLYFHVTDACRSLYATFVEEVTFMGIDGYRFRAPEDFMANASVKPENECYCVPLIDDSGGDGCLGSGMINLVNCMTVPVYQSFPHFLYGDPKYSAAVIDDVLVDPKKHNTYLDVEPWTGFPLRAYKRAQMNFPIGNFNDSRLHLLSELPEEIVMPIAWAEEGGEISKELAEDWKNQVGKPLQLVDIARWVIFSLGLLLLIGGILLMINDKIKSNRDQKLSRTQ